MKKKEAFSIIGAGRVGTTLGFLLKEAGYRPLSIVDRSLLQAQKAAAFIGAGRPGADPAEAAAGHFLMLCVPDSAIAGLTSSLSRIAESWEDRIVFHCSGAMTSAVLRPLEKAGAATGSFHPLQTFVDPETAVKLLRNAWFCIEGSPRFRALASCLVESLEGNMMEIPADKKVIYHAAAVFASNFLVVLMDQAASLMSEAGLSKEEAIRALLPLAEGVLSGITDSGTARAMTGPVERGDAGTVQAHLEALNRLDPAAAQLYRNLSLQALRMTAQNHSSGLEKILGSSKGE